MGNEMLGPRIKSILGRWKDFIISKLFKIKPTPNRNTWLSINVPGFTTFAQPSNLVVLRIYKRYGRGNIRDKII